jgi:hypothetical protein
MMMRMSKAMGLRLSQPALAVAGALCACGTPFVGQVDDTDGTEGSTSAPVGTTNGVPDEGSTTTLDDEEGACPFPGAAEALMKLDLGPEPGCTEDRQCPETWICQEGVCRYTIPCDVHADCWIPDAAGPTCIEGVCRRVPCRADPDCREEGIICQAGGCEPTLDCEVFGDCMLFGSAGPVCVEGSCRLLSCEQGSACPSEAACDGQICRPILEVPPCEAPNLGELEVPFTIPPALDIAIADVAGTPPQDIMIAGPQGITLMIGAGSPMQPSTRELPYPLVDPRIRWINLDGEEGPEIVVVDRSSTRVTYTRPNSVDQISEPMVLGEATCPVADITGSDLDADGRLDLVLALHCPEPMLELWRGRGDDVFERIEIRETDGESIRWLQRLEGPWPGNACTASFNSWIDDHWTTLRLTHAELEANIALPLPLVAYGARHDGVFVVDIEGEQAASVDLHWPAFLWLGASVRAAAMVRLSNDTPVPVFATTEQSLLGFTIVESDDEHPVPTACRWELPLPFSARLLRGGYLYANAAGPGTLALADDDGEVLLLRP